MAQIRISQAARFVGVSDDTVRRWIDQGLLARGDGNGPATVDGLELARLVRDSAVLPADPADIGRSARNRFVGIVTEVIVDRVMAQVELQCGPHRVVALISAEAVRELGLEPGDVATAVVKATNVVIEQGS
ncbi:MAG: TOBE domain-containing protein [Microbacteriaceae bacterium]|nr:TOBE domain-containing protein [Microbacteriaceae bacterium]